MKNKVVTFGEIMLRLSTENNSRFVQSSRLDVTYGGGEANVAVGLANFGLESFFVTKLPKHEIGQSALNHLRRFGVNTDYIVRGGERLGIYFLETGASQRPSKVIYDRNDSAISQIQPDEINWFDVLDQAQWFHFTGITPALGNNAQQSLLLALKTAKEKGVKVSCDLNFRKKMWTELEAQRVMQPLMEYVDVCIANEEDAEKSLGMKPKKIIVENAQLNLDSYFELLYAMKDKFCFSTVAVTLRESHSASQNGWSAVMLDDKDCIEPKVSKHYDIQIIDRVGGGDAFASGLIYGLLKKQNTMDALEFAVAASCLKHTIPGDFNHVSLEEVEKLSKGDASGRVER